MGMGETSENVAEKFGVNREKQDKMAVESHQKAYKAQKAGLFKGKTDLTQIKLSLSRQQSWTRMETQRR